MIIYELYQMFTENSSKDSSITSFGNCFLFTCCCIFALPLDILISPITIIALIIYKINKRRNNNGL